MKTHQINLKIPDNLFTAAKSFARHFGFRNIQELALDSIREKVFEENKYDETFTEKEIKLIEKLVKFSIKKNKLHDITEIFPDFYEKVAD